MQEWSLPRAAFANASAAAPFGMILGGLLGGVLGDRIGRTRTLLGSVALFAVFTALVAAVPGVRMLIAVRFLAGLGLGGAMPNAAALTAELVPGRRRPIAITLTIVCIPVGGVLAGLVAAQIIPAFGWRTLFLAGGIVPLAIALGLRALLPESPRFLAAAPHRWPELRATLARMGHHVDAKAVFVEAAAAPSKGSIGELLSASLRRDTLALVGAFGSCLLAIWMAFLWIPSMLTDPGVGFSLPQASFALSLFNFGGVAGAIVGALLIQRFGSRPTLLTISALAIAATLAMSAMTWHPRVIAPAMTMLTVAGVLLNAVQATMYAVAAHVYPTAIRGTGVGATVAVGRLGNVAASYSGSWALSAGGPPLYFQMWAAAMLLVFVCLTAMRRHIPAR
jgi:AAHS family 4-hydroxybenzoate transporter-like MFS transporter